MPNKALSRGGIAVRIHKPSCSGVIIAGQEVVEPTLGVVIISPVTKWVFLGQFTGSGEEFAVGVIGIGRLALMPFPP